MILYKTYKPEVDKSVYVALHTAIVGRVSIGADSSIWFGAVLRGDVSYIQIGKGSNIQDNTTVHVGHDIPTIIGDNVTVGHNCIIHGCTLEDDTLIGMGSTILDNAKISKNSIVGANSLVTMNKVFKEGVLIMGSPAKVIRDLTEDEIASIHHSAQDYISVSRDYMKK